MRYIQRHHYCFAHLRHQCGMGEEGFVEGRFIQENSYGWSFPGLQDVGRQQVLGDAITVEPGEATVGKVDICIYGLEER